MAERLIDAEALEWIIRNETWLHYQHSDVILISLDDVIEGINEMPTIEAKPIVHAHWKKWGCEGTVCSNCYGRVLYECDEQEKKSKYCPHCGATMDEKESD